MDLEGLSRPPEESTPTAGGPADEIEPLCYAGESVVDAVPFSGGTVGVTTHRVLALTPDGDGPNLQAVERPNVDGVELSAGGDAAHGARALRYGVYALALVGASFVVDFSSVSAVDPPSGTGAGRVVQMAVTMTGMLTLVDDVLRYAGLGVLVVALLFLALYGHTRDSYVAIGVAGGRALRVPATGSESAAVDRLRAAVADASGPAGGDPAQVEKASNPFDG